MSDMIKTKATFADYVALPESSQMLAATSIAKTLVSGRSEVLLMSVPQTSV